MMRWFTCISINPLARLTVQLITGVPRKRLQEGTHQGQCSRAEMKFGKTMSHQMKIILACLYKQAFSKLSMEMMRIQNYFIVALCVPISR